MTGVVRPFEARVVRQEWAAQAVTPMVEALGERRPPTPVPATAYDDSPRAFYVYRMRRGSDDHVGVVADVRLDAFAGGAIRGHESVDPHRVDALVAYYAALPTRSEPVALLHAHRPGTTRRVEDICRGRPLLHFPGPEGLEHTVWRVTGDEETTDLAAALDDGVHYIADGHHRVAARLRAWERAGRPADAGVLCMVFAMEGLTMSAFHRRVSGPVDAAALLDAAAAPLHGAAGGHGRRRRAGSGCTSRGAGTTSSRQEPVPKERPGWTPPSCRTDCSARRWASPGRGTPGSRCSPTTSRSSSRQRGATRTAGCCSCSAPPSLRRLTRIADLGEQMPPKTTYFAPKPSAGIFLT